MNDHGTQNHLCCGCRHATAIDCPWIGQGDTSDLVRVRKISHMNGQDSGAVVVQACRRYKAGRLPRLRLMPHMVEWLANADRMD